MNAEQLRAHVVDTLSATPTPMSTRDVRIAIAKLGEHSVRPVVAERVYRTLLALQRHGLVRRVHDQADHHAYWALIRTPAHPDCRHSFAGKAKEGSSENT